MKLFILLLIGVFLAGVGAYVWFIQSSSPMTGIKDVRNEGGPLTAESPAHMSEDDTKFYTYTNSELGFSASVPVGWEVNEGVGSVSVTASDFKMQDPLSGSELGRTYTVESGGQIILGHVKDSNDASIQDPEAFIAFKKQLEDDMRGFVSSERVMLDGIPALLQYHQVISDKDEDASGVMMVEVPLGADTYSINYAFSSDSPTTEDKAIFQKLIESFRILP